MSRVVAGWCILLGALVLVSADPTRSEQMRLRAHFDSVLIELQERDVSSLTGDQRDSRDRLIKWLAEYRDAGRFPLNDRYANDPTPIFRDVRGATCAMAYLIERSGRADIVDRIAETRNLAYIGELADDTAVVAWLDRSGLSVAEAARIQPGYERENELGITVGFAVGTVVLSGTSLAIAASNAFRPGEGMGFVGMAVGTVTVMLGGVTSITRDYRPLAAANILSGGLAIVTGFYAAFRPRPVPPTRSEFTADRRAKWMPLADVDPLSWRKRFGLAIRF